MHRRNGIAGVGGHDYSSTRGPEVYEAKKNRGVRLVQKKRRARGESTDIRWGQAKTKGVPRRKENRGKRREETIISDDRRKFRKGRIDSPKRGMGSNSMQGPLTLVGVARKGRGRQTVNIVSNVNKKVCENNRTR